MSGSLHFSVDIRYSHSRPPQTSTSPYTFWIPDAHYEREQRRQGSTNPVQDVPVIPDPEIVRSALEEDATQSILFYDKDDPYYDFTNFAPISVTYDGLYYQTAEHLFQAHKFLPAHPALADRIRLALTAREALHDVGRLHQYQRRDWFDVNVSVMEEVLKAKFSQHRRLKRHLLQTGERELVEASPVDSFWGHGPDGKGRNELGKALMRLRDCLRGEESNHSRRTTTRDRMYY